MVESGSLENCCGSNVTVGSNPTPSANRKTLSDRPTKLRIYMKNFDSPIKSAVEMLKQVRVSTVLNSLLWLVFVLLLALVFTSFGENASVQIFLMVMVSITITVIIVSFIGILLTKNFNLLRSEKHVFNMKALEILGDQDYTVKNLVDSSGGNNPTLPSPKGIAIPDQKEIRKKEGNNHG